MGGFIVSGVSDSGCQIPGSQRIGCKIVSECDDAMGLYFLGQGYFGSEDEGLQHQLQIVGELEARVGIEPTHKGFADLSLTTWVPRLELSAA